MSEDFVSLFGGGDTTEKKEINLEAYYNIEKDKVQDSDFWTNQFYKGAYDKVKGRELIPVVIPSYNKPDNKFLSYAVENTVKGKEYPIYIVVRDSQKETYENTDNVKNNDFVHILSFEDSLIDDIGKVRKNIVDYFASKKTKYIFMFDDDITKFSYSVPLKRDTGTKISYSYDPGDFGGVMAMWQIAMEKITKDHPNLILSTGMVQGFSWVEDGCFEESSVAYMRGLPTLAVCLNIEAIAKNNINYRTIKNNGHDDIDFLIRALLKGCPVAEFRWLTYCNPGIGTSLLGFDTVKERFERQYNEMKANFDDVSFIRWRDRKGVKNVGINWNACLDYFEFNNFENFKYNRLVNIWNDGELLNG